MQSNKKANSAEAGDALTSPSNPAHYYAYFSALWLFLLSVPLMAFPRLLLILSTPRGAAGQAETDNQGSGVSAIGPDLTPLERFGSYSNAFSMLCVAAVVLMLTGAVPITTSPVADPASSGAASPYRFPTIVVTALYFGANAALAYGSVGSVSSSAETNNPKDIGIGNAGMALALGHGLFAAWGFWVWLFGADATRNAKKYAKDAKDKSVSSFPFKNEYAQSEKSK